MLALEALQFAGQRVGSQRISQRHLQPLGARRFDDKIACARAHGGDDIVDAAMRRLDDYGNGDVGVPHARQHAKPVEIRHDKVEDDSVKAFGIGTNQQFAGRVAALDDGRPVAEPLDHCFEQAPLDRIVVDDEHHFRHHTPHAHLYRIGAMSPVCLNRLLMGFRAHMRLSALGLGGNFRLSDRCPLCPRKRTCAVH